MLDWAHGTTLQAVANGKDAESPALDTLIASGLVERGADGSLRVTAAGEVALESDKPPRWERIAWPVVAVVGAVYAVLAVVDWVT